MAALYSMWSHFCDCIWFLILSDLLSDLSLPLPLLPYAHFLKNNSKRIKRGRRSRIKAKLRVCSRYSIPVQVNTRESSIVIKRPSTTPVNNANLRNILHVALRNLIKFGM